MNENNNTSIEFWRKYADKQILEAIQQYLYKQYGFKKDVTPFIENEFLKNIYNTTHVLEFFIDEGWGNFEKSIWNTSSVFLSIGYFSGRLLEELEKRIRYYDPEDHDMVQEYIIDSQALLQSNISEAIRLHRVEFDGIINELELLINKNNERRDAIFIEKWKQ